MQRIAILGNAAGGKSTLARHLSRVRGLPLTEIDAIYWNPDWSMVPRDVYARTHDAIIAQDNWIVEGVGGEPSILRRAERATELILLDLPLWVHFWHAAERQMAWANGTIAHPPAGGRGMPPTKRLFEMIAEFDRDWMPMLRTLCDAQEAMGKQVTRLTTIAALDAFTQAAMKPN